MSILFGSLSHNLPIETHKAGLILEYVGNSTIQASPLVQQVLNGSTSPLHTSIYLESTLIQSTTGCSNVPNYNTDIYSNTFLRFIFSRLQSYASYNLSYVMDLELVAPVIDCTFDLLTAGDTSIARVYYLVRRNDNSTHMMLLSTSLSAQDYVIDKQHQQGPATLLLVAAIDDVRATTITHDIAIAYNYPYVAEPEFAYSKLNGIDENNHWLLQTLANPRTRDPAKDARTVRRFGRYLSDPTSQLNIKMSHWEIPTNPAAELGSMLWQSHIVSHDSWAWTHAVHGLFALEVIFNFGVLSFIMFRRIRVGQFWVGDAFSTISRTLIFRGLLVILCNIMNGFWTITKMCIFIGDSITGLDVIYYRPELVHADLLAVFLCALTVLCYATQERVTPLLAIAVFELSWQYKVELVKLFPISKSRVSGFALADLTDGLVEATPYLDALSPLNLITANEVVGGRHPVVFLTALSIFSPIILIAAFIAVQRAIRYIKSKKSGKNERSSVYTKNLPPMKLTSFEVATGAALSKRSGIISDYEDYTMWDNRPAATVDAVYGNGFLVVNAKYLIGAEDLLPLLVMKLTSVRFTSIFVYQISEASSVRETADLVYPSTISWNDLRHIDVARLI
ncbi:uncharacterized protein PHALS_13245 [Plasmopara halstedii]|uniref:Transmembrane protein n=1 Tax=Plasmopara halstedii TaxID=4781 RepID=A0A0P1ANQ5_PLAHL|nr:uncharacterized protein PHALS_13245 [Plasmopara halstedii]CEG43020.1 hypothetical protein PHALS_13245 [Plasmopara halstedii]|eukprot:XP_024579389.1 hypothetical protein PHALS_13245 [Plasmopara halstedii]